MPEPLVCERLQTTNDKITNRSTVIEVAQPGAPEYNHYVLLCRMISDAITDAYIRGGGANKVNVDINVLLKCLEVYYSKIPVKDGTPQEFAKQYQFIIWFLNGGLIYSESKRPKPLKTLEYFTKNKIKDPIRIPVFLDCQPTAPITAGAQVDCDAIDPESIIEVTFLPTGTTGQKPLTLNQIIDAYTKSIEHGIPCNINPNLGAYQALKQGTVLPSINGANNVIYQINENNILLDPDENTIVIPANNREASEHPVTLIRIECITPDPGLPNKKFIRLTFKDTETFGTDKPNTFCIDWSLDAGINREVCWETGIFSGRYGCILTQLNLNAHSRGVGAIPSNSDPRLREIIDDILAKCENPPVPTPSPTPLP